MSTTVLLDAQRLSSVQAQSQANTAMADNTRERFPSLDLSATGPVLERTRSHEEVFASPAAISPWQPRQRQDYRDNRFESSPYRHRARKSISEALGNFATRRGSVSVNAQELAESLKAPVSYKLIGLCICWYMSSALTNTSSKSILNTFPKPITLTIIQFAFVSLWCVVFAWLARIFPALRTAVPALRNGLRYPTPDVILTALPLSIFQLLGHILSATATEKIPVSLVHTIKGLSPLFTVLAYRLFFRIRYARATYLSLIPLTTGVMLACSADISTNFVGISCAFIAAIVFVAQNIFSKKLFNEASRAESGENPRKLDKLNLLCYCSAGAFVLTAPVWFFSEGLSITSQILQSGSVDLHTPRKGALDHGGVMLEYFFNGVFHFGQNILAFVLLSMLSPVSYSVASLIKRVWVVVVAILWFGSSTTLAQAAGIILTFLGLYLYDRTSMDDAAERRAKSDHFRQREHLLPLVEKDEKPSPIMNHHLPTFSPHQGVNGHPITSIPSSNDSNPAYTLDPAFEFPSNNMNKQVLSKDNKSDSNRKEDPPTTNNNRRTEPGSRPRSSSAVHQHLLPGAKAESTWVRGDRLET